MTEPTETRPESPSLEALIDMSFTLLAELLKVYGLEEDDDEVEHDYSINVNREVPILVLDINAKQEIRSTLFGHRGANVLAMERILIGALYRRLGLKDGQRLDRAVQLSVNGKRPDTRREDGERPDTRGERSSAGVVTIILPPGVKLRALNPDGTDR